MKTWQISGLIGFIIPFVFFLTYLAGFLSHDTSFSYGVLILTFIIALVCGGIYSFAGYLLQKKKGAWAVIIYIGTAILAIIIALSTAMFGATG